MKTWIKNWSRMLLIGLCSLIIPTTEISAACPLTHAAMTEIFFAAHPKYQGAEKESFRMGTLFSGIYNLGGLTQEQISFPDVTLQQILDESSPFTAGMMFHAYVDNHREQYLADVGPLAVLNELGITHTVLYTKFLEDQILYSSIDKAPWKAAVNFIHNEELGWGIDQAILDKWHYLLNMSFSYQPSTLILFAYIQGQGLLDVSHEEMSLWYNTFSATASRQEVKDYVSGLTNMFQEEIKSGI